MLLFLKNTHLFCNFYIMRRNSWQGGAVVVIHDNTNYTSTVVLDGFTESQGGGHYPVVLPLETRGVI